VAALFVTALLIGNCLTLIRNDVPCCCRINVWERSKLDFRSLISFKNQLFDSPALNSNNVIPVTEFKRIATAHDSAMIKAQVGGTEDLILKEIAVPDNPAMCDLNRFSDLVDLYVYMPSKESGKHQ